MLFCRLLIFFKINYFQIIPSVIPSMSNSLDPDQAGHFVRPDLAPNCLQRLPADDTSRQNQTNKMHFSKKVCVWCWLYDNSSMCPFKSCNHFAEEERAGSFT